MTDEETTTTENEDTGAAGDAAADEAAEGASATPQPAEEATPAVTAAAAPDPRREAVMTRGILPLALPLLSALAVAIWVVNLSRAFLAGGEQGALVIVLIVTVSIIVGAALMSAMPHMERSTQTIITIGFIVVILSAGLVSLGPSEEAEGGGGGFVEPSGPAVATLEVDALPSLNFQSDAFTTAAGINEIDYVGKGGTHTLTFEEQTPDTQGFLLEVSGAQTDKSKVRLEPGDYTIYCTIAGHRAAGMEATLTVQEGAPATPESPPAP
jgi:plastocyanin